MGRSSRATERGDLLIQASSQKSQATFLNDAYKLWNSAPLDIKRSEWKRLLLKRWQDD